MEPLTVVLLIAGGACAGLLAGLFGISEGLLLVTLLLAVEQRAGVTSLISTHVAIGTSLVVIALGALRPSFSSFRQDSVVRPAALIAGVAGMAGAFCLGLLAGGATGKSLRVIAGLAAAVSALRLFAEQRRPKGEQRNEPLRLALTGVLGGGISSLTGAGASMIVTPMLYSGERFPQTKAIGTSSVVTLVAAAAGAAGYCVAGLGNVIVPEGFAGYLHPLPAVLLSIGAIPSTIAGMRLASRIKGSLPRKLVAFLLLLIAARLFLI